ncbi:MAG: NTP transferase domain-containing protein [Gemmatimonadales bacterium]|nr:NTP transferase domain-containing protein [Gemmatimonadales bacterium]
MRATTAVVLARGLGTRMRAEAPDAPVAGLSAEQRAAARAGAKGLIPVGGTPLLDHVLHELAEGGVRTVVFVVAPGESALRDRYLRVAPPERLQVRFVEQAEARGTADALLSARAAIAPGEEFLMLNADNLYPSAAVAALVALDGPGLVAFEARALSVRGNVEPERVMRFALLDLAPDDTLREIVEKPPADHPLARAAERWVSMNLWRFHPRIFADCARVRPSARGELELADAVREAIARGERFRAVRQRTGVLDLSSQGDVAAVDTLLAGRRPRP